MAQAISIILSGMLTMEEVTEIIVKASKMNLTSELIDNLRELKTNNKFNKKEVYKILKEMKIKD